MKTFLFVLALLLSSAALGQEPDLYDHIPDAYIDEADQFSAYCERTPTLNSNYNCPCLSVAFLDERIKRGPRADRSNIMLGIEGKCLDVVMETGARYEACMNSAPPRDIPHKDYCECLANTYAHLMTASREPPSARLSVELQTQAMVGCSNPDLGKRLYQPGR